MSDIEVPLTAVREGMNRLRGRLFGAIEAAGLPERQEAGIKGLIRSTTYDLQADLESALRKDQHG